MAYGELSSNSSFGLSGYGGPAVAASLIVQTPTTARTIGNKRIATPGGAREIATSGADSLAVRMARFNDHVSGAPGGGMGGMGGMDM